MEVPQEFKVSNGYYLRQFMRVVLVSALVFFGLSIAKDDGSHPLLVTLGGVLIFSFAFLVQHSFWPELTEIIISPSEQNLTYKLLWRRPIFVEFGQLNIEFREWAGRSSPQKGLLFSREGKLQFRASVGPWNENDLMNILRLTNSSAPIQ